MEKKNIAVNQIDLGKMYRKGFSEEEKQALIKFLEKEKIQKEKIDSCLQSNYELYRVFSAFQRNVETAWKNISVPISVQHNGKQKVTQITESTSFQIPIDFVDFIKNYKYIDKKASLFKKRGGDYAIPLNITIDKKRIVLAMSDGNIAFFKEIAFVSKNILEQDTLTIKIFKVNIDDILKIKKVTSIKYENQRLVFYNENTEVGNIGCFLSRYADFRFGSLIEKFRESNVEIELDFTNLNFTKSLLQKEYRNSLVRIEQIDSKPFFCLGGEKLYPQKISRLDLFDEITKEGVYLLKDKEVVVARFIEIEPIKVIGLVIDGNTEVLLLSK